ncbi:MAG: hypothetical protein MUQ27_01575 [Acidimicrobiia bacterium]|nr:hypothetical protein [Acidimicrobiia bacterium]
MRHLTTILVSVVFLVAGCGGSVQEPQFAVGVVGPAVLDEAGIVADWELIGGPDEELPLQYQLGFNENDFGVVSAAPESTELVVSWSAVPCQLEPVAQVTSPNGGIHIEVTPGPNPVEHCAAMAIGYGFRLTLTEPLGDRAVTAKLIDPVNQQLAEFPPPSE